VVTRSWVTKHSADLDMPQTLQKLFPKLIYQLLHAEVVSV
jgi:hypothetical protein